MREPSLSCPLAYYGHGMKVLCRKTRGSFCGFQYYKRCQGWWALTEAAGRCRLRSLPAGEDEEGGPGHGP